MEFIEYQGLAKRTINKNLSKTQQQLHALHGMVGEIGEIHSIYQKVYQGHDLDGRKLMYELGDLLWFIAEYCTACGWKMEEIAWMNIKKLAERYPDGFEELKSMNRKAEKNSDWYEHD